MTVQVDRPIPEPKLPPFKSVTLTLTPEEFHDLQVMVVNYTSNMDNRRIELNAPYSVSPGLGSPLTHDYITVQQRILSIKE